METNPALEQAIYNNPDDESAYSVLADWLQSKGDPRGELIALELAGKSAEAGGLLVKHGGALLGDLADHQKVHDGSNDDAFTWKWGFIQRAKLSHNHYADEAFKGSMADVLRALLDHPSGQFIRELSFAFNNDPNEDDLQTMIDVLAEKQRPTIRSLFFGDFKYAGAARDEDRGEDTEISWYAIGDLSKLWVQVPNLETLIIQCGSSQSAIAGVGATLGEVVLPKLKHFEYRTGGLEQATMQSIAQMQAPALEHIDVWFGQDNYGGTSTIDDARALLSRKDFPNVTHLGVMNCEFIDELAPELGKLPLAHHLTELDISLGCLTDEGAEALAQARADHPKLAKLAATHNFLSSTGEAALGKITTNLVADEQRESDDEDRYTAVGE